MLCILKEEDYNNHGILEEINLLPQPKIEGK
jgi:hypothetical protein